VLGRVLGARGTRGELRIRWLGDGPDNLLRAPTLAFGSADPAAPVMEAMEVLAARPGRTGELRVTLRGVESREAAEALVGRFASGEARWLAPLPSGEYYGHEWIGCAVEAHDGRALGTLRALWDTGAHDVLVVEGEDGRELLLPAAQELLREVDVERGRIVIEVPEGLLDPA